MIIGTKTSKYRTYKIKCIFRPLFPVIINQFKKSEELTIIHVVLFQSIKEDIYYQHVFIAR